MTAQAQDWDASTYNRVANPHEQWGERVLDRLPLRGDETVLDAGCGSGRVTRLLIERLPRGRVIGVDASPAMLAVAHEQLAPLADRVRLVEANLVSVQLPAPVDAIFSSATFHWIADHAALFANLATLLRPGGMLVAQCGGSGNTAEFTALAAQALEHEPFRPYAEELLLPYNFATPAETEARLLAAGFVDVHAWLESAPAVFADGEAFGTFARTILLRPYFTALPAALHDAFVAAVVAKDERDGGHHLVDYVRLNFTARRDAS